MGGGEANGIGGIGWIAGVPIVYGPWMLRLWTFSGLGSALGISLLATAATPSLRVTVDRFEGAASGSYSLSVTTRNVHAERAYQTMRSRVAEAWLEYRRADRQRMERLETQRPDDAGVEFWRQRSRELLRQYEFFRERLLLYPTGSAVTVASPRFHPWERTAVDLPAEAVELSGPSELPVAIALYRHRRFWFPKLVGAETVTVSVKGDPMARFELRTSGLVLAGRIVLGPPTCAGELSNP